VSIELAPKRRESHGIYVTIFLLFLNLTLLSVQVEDPSGTTIFKRWVLGASAPFINLSAGLSRGLREVWTNYIWLHGARAENAQLQRQVEQLSLQVRTLRQFQGENDRLRSLLSFKEGTQFKSLGARIVGRTPDFLSRIVYLDRGSADGVRVDCPVVRAEGIVGRVVLVTSHNSQVQLITNADASAGVMIERTGTPGVVRGLGGHLLDVAYISSTEEVAVGDLVVTSGKDGIYPKGLPVGIVLESTKGKTVFRNIRIEPLVDLLRIDEALILLSPTGSPGGEAQSVPDGPRNVRD
jgi:rod shape-determining protein MreC